MSSKEFYTVGYEGLGIRRFIEILKDNGVKTLADARYNPFSMNPDFRQKKLVQHLEQAGMGYVHLKTFGIPSEIRKSSQNPIAWYAKNVKPNIKPSILDDLRQPVCFMCMESDLDNCHRKVILETLQEQGLHGRDLYPIDRSKALLD